MKNFIIINFNTQEFVDKLILSINKFVNNARIIVFDNSDKEPFINNTENVEVIDNTKGQIIDFEKFLSKYTNRRYSAGYFNKCASAKHCYTIQKCIDLMEDNFILLDSDVLLKQDVSSLFDDNYIYCGEVIRQDNGKLRVAPFMCFINVKMCKEHNIKFFDDKYMHGCYVTPEADKYDTGGAFYVNSEKYPHKEIRLSDYIVHYGHGSWNKPGYKKLSSKDFFEEYKNCWL